MLYSAIKLSAVRASRRRTGGYISEASELRLIIDAAAGLRVTLRGCGEACTSRPLDDASHVQPKTLTGHPPPLPDIPVRKTTAAYIYPRLEFSYGIKVRVNYVRGQINRGGGANVVHSLPYIRSRDKVRPD